MSGWNVIECGFNTEDQTFNFGTRCFGGDNNLYEACTLASIRSSDASEQQANSDINCFIKSNKVFYVIHKTLGIFTDLNCVEIDFNVIFEESIDIICVTDNAKYTLVGLRDGSLQLLNIEDKVCLLESKMSDSFREDNSFMGCYLQHFGDDEIVFIIVTETGDIYRIDIKDPQGSCVLKKELIIQTHCSTKNVGFNYPYIFLNGSEMMIHNLENGEQLEDEPLDIIKVFPCDTDTFLILDVTGNLIQICTKTLIRYIISTVLFRDITFLQNRNDGKGKCLLVAFANKEESGPMCLQAFESWSSFHKPIFSLQLTDEVYLISPECIYRDPMYVTAIKDNTGGIEFRIHAVCETDPEKRLERLLKRQKFDEAEKFAKLFNLDRNQILKGRAQALIIKMSCDTEAVNNWLQILDEIDDVEFKLQCCYDMYQHCDNVDNVRVVLQYAFCHVKSNSDNEEIADLASKVTDMLSKVNTFMLIKRYKTSLIWDDFAHCNAIDLVNHYLQKADIKIATIIYNRMDVKVSLTDIQKILNSLDRLPLMSYRPFLYSFISISLEHLPSSAATYVKWFTQKVYEMEKTNFAQFPQEAITFANDLIKLLVHNSVQMENSSYREAVEDFRILFKALNRSKFISTKYKISIPLKEYVKGSKSLICALLNIRLTEERFNMFFDDFLYNFMLENNFHPDDVLLEEIENLIQYEESYWIDTVSRCLPKINSIEKKLQPIYKIALSAKVPWSQSVKNIVGTALQYDHPLVSNIIEEIKNEPRKSILTKYNLYRYIKTSNLDFWINRILYCNLETMVEDVLTISRTPADRQRANYKLFHDLISKKKYEDALKVLHTILPEDLFVFRQDIIQIIIISSKRCFKNIQHYPAILPSIRSYYKEKRCENIYDARLNHVFDAITSYFYIKKIYNEVTVNDLLDPKKQAVLYNKLIERVVCDFENDIDTLDVLIDQTSKYLNVPKEDIMLKLVEKCSHSHVIQKCGEHYYLYENNPKQLCKMATLIIKSISPVKNDTLADISSLDFTMYDTNYTSDINTLISNVKLAQKLAIKATLMAKDMNRYEPLEYLYTLKNFLGTITEKCAIRKFTFLNIDTCANTAGSITPSTRIFRTVKDMLTVYVACVELYNIPSTKYLTYFNATDISLTEVDNQQIKTQITVTVKDLFMEGHVLAAYQLIAFFLMRLSMGTNTDTNITSALRRLLKQQCIPQLLERIFASNAIDHQFAFSLLISIDFSQFRSLIKQYIVLYKADPIKLNNIMHLVMKVFKYHNVNPDESYTQILLLSKWWLKIDNCQIHMKTFYTSPSKELLNLLFQHNHLKLEMMEEFCADFKLDIQLCYNVYLEKLITSWKPDYEINQKADGESELVMKSTEDELYEKCRRVLELIKCKDTIRKCIEQFSSSINFYYYEAFLCVLNILSSLTNTTCYVDKQKLLRFLKVYSRVSKPSNLELEEWFAVFPGSCAIEPLSKWRLPFSQMFFTERIWKILRSEINLKTYTIWFKAIAFLHKSLNVDDICSFVVKDVVSSGILRKGAGDGWVLIPVHESLFEEIDCCIQHISDIEKATSAIYHLMIHTPKGADQVNAALLSLKYAKKYKQHQAANDTGVDEAYKKVHNKYLKLSVSHILHLCKLNSEIYGEVLLHPEELIDTLYMHNDIIQSANAILLSCPDINKAVDDIAKLYGIDILQKRKGLLEAFLATENNTHFDIDGSSIEDAEIKNLKRATYICQSGDLVYWQKHLVTIGIEEDIPSLSIRVRANALKCLTMISDVESIETYVDLQYNAFLNYIDKLYLLSDLESRGFSMTLEQLNAYNKKLLLRRLSKDMYSPMIVKIMGDICMVYSICDTKYWNKIVEMSIKLNLHANLKKYINFWSTNLESRYKNFYINAWQYVVNKSFFESSSNKESDIFNLCVKNMLMIQSCPVLHFLNFNEVFSKLCQMERYDFAAVIIQYMPEEKQEEFISEILSHTNQVPDFSTLAECGICGIDLTELMFK